MSSSAAMTLIAAATLSTMFVFFWITKLANDAATNIMIGVIQGIPVSRKHRATLLYQDWIGYVGGAVVSAIFLGVLSIRIAAIATDEAVKSVAYVAAVIGFSGSVMWAASAVQEFRHYQALVRQAEADRPCFPALCLSTVHSPGRA